MLEHHWKHLDNPAFGLMNQISELVHSLDVRQADRLPDLRRGSTILIGSDYSGDHAASEYQVLSFVLADIEHSVGWTRKRRRIRASLPDDGRRFAFKNLSERSLARALPDFVAAADQIPGLLVTVLTHKAVDSLFKLTGRIEPSDREISEFPGWKPKVMERLLRVVHFISLFVSGLSRPSQDVLWVTDEDAIVPNEAKHRELVTIFGRVCSHYLAHTLRHMRVATTASDSGKRDVEDFVSLSDLACGALAEVATRYRRTGTLVGGGVVTPVPRGLSSKTLHVMNWLSDDRHALKKLFLAIDPFDDSTALTVRLLNFHGSAGGARSAPGIDVIR